MAAVECPKCGKSLKVKDSLVGKRVRCPGCENPFVIPDALVVELVEEEEKEPEQRVTKQPRRDMERRPSFRRPRDEEDEENEVVRTDQKRKQKKRRPPPKRSEPQFPAWALWLIIVGGFILLAGSIALGAAFTGHAEEALVYSVTLAVMVPISTVILIISMFISSWLGGGIEFGDARVVIPKAFGLLLLVNMISLLPLGGFLAFPVWAIGLMLLFGLELWEARVLILVNWGLNFLVRMAIFGAIMAAMAH